MTSDPVAIALREIAETKHLVEALVLTRTVDYLTAEAILEQLDRKVRRLGKIEARLMEECRTSDRIVVFPGSERRVS